MRQTFPKFRKAALWQWLIFLSALVVLLGAVVWVAGKIGTGNADRVVLERGEATTQLQVSALLAELDKQRAVRFLVARDADVIAGLNAPTPERLMALNGKLKTLSEGSGASVIYIIDTNGLTVAASNYDTEQSFVGNNYEFRAYFLDAMRAGTGQVFAMGATSRRPGLYISEQIEGPNGTAGIVAVKIDFTALEELWTPGNAATYASDERGVVLLSSVPSWQFYVETERSAPEVRQLRDSLQYADAPLRPLPVDYSTDHTGVVQAVIPPGERPEEFAKVRLTVPSVDWHLTALFPLKAERETAIVTTRAIGGAIVLMIGAIAGTILAISQRAHSARLRLAEQHDALERAVALRTADLAESNEQLVHAIYERDAAEQKAAQLRDDLAQANRLASLGQIAAGVAHEINQPLGAIRAYAENGQTFISRDDADAASENLGAIGRLTERIASITEHLKTFARKGRGKAEEVDLRASVDAALSLMRSSIRNHRIEIVYSPPQTPALVLADTTGIEQIIINLIQNAMEALDDTPNPRIDIKLAWGERAVALSIADNGPGIAPKIAEQLFIPFLTSKAKGLGLGLVISQDLAQSFGASLALDTNYTAGARFVLSFPRSL